MKRSTKGRALFYSRDSGGKHEMTPGQYVAWAQTKSRELGLSFDGTPERIEAMARQDQPVRGDIFFDRCVAGNQLSRAGLDALLREAKEDRNVSHVFIPRRDRLARPDDPIDAVQIENGIRRFGITLVFMDQTFPPLSKGKRANTAEVIMAVVDYDSAGRDRRELAEKILYAQLTLARAGYSTGGRPPYGFRRWLVKEDGSPVRQLAEGERVRMRGHHVVWLPGPDEEIGVIRRIVGMLETMPANRVAATLTKEGVRTPDFERYRKDHGVRHRTSGVWNQTTIVNIARNPLLMAVSSYGRRSMGDQLRFSGNGPRELNDDDFRDEEKPKVVRNPESACITVPATFEPVVAPDRHKELIAQLDERGKSQRGKPRSRNPDKNPLGSRVFDMNCGWPMYRGAYCKSFRYTCGYYSQSHGQKCAHNHVDGPTATRFVLGCLRQRMLSPTFLPKLKQRLMALATRDAESGQSQIDLAEKQKALATVQEELETVSTNLARAGSDDQFAAIASEFNRLKAAETALGKELEQMAFRTAAKTNTEAEVDAALELIGRITDLAGKPGDLKQAGEIIRLTNTNLFLRFQPTQVKQRVLNKLKSGVVTFGAAQPPISIYTGHTSRDKVRRPTADAAGPCEETPPTPNAEIGGEGNSLGNVNRGDPLLPMVDETAGLGLTLSLFPQVLDFPGDAVLQLVEPGLYSKRR